MNRSNGLCYIIGAWPHTMRGHAQRTRLSSMRRKAPWRRVKGAWIGFDAAADGHVHHRRRLIDAA